MTTLDALAHALPLAADAPVMDGPALLRIASRALHILCAIILGGGLFYLRAVLAPAGPEACFADRRAVWSRWIAIASTVLIVTGLYNFIMIVRAAKAPGAQQLASTYHMLFGIKFLLALVVMFIASLLAGRSAGADKARANMSRWLAVAWTCVIAIAILGSMMRLFHAP